MIVRLKQNLLVVTAETEQERESLVLSWRIIGCAFDIGLGIRLRYMTNSVMYRTTRIPWRPQITIRIYRELILAINRHAELSLYASLDRATLRCLSIDSARRVREGRSGKTSFTLVGRQSLSLVDLAMGSRLTIPDKESQRGILPWFAYCERPDPRWVRKRSWRQGGTNHREAVVDILLEEWIQRVTPFMGRTRYDS
jgi:hypothetical protein